MWMWGIEDLYIGISFEIISIFQLISNSNYVLEVLLDFFISIFHNFVLIFQIFRDEISSLKFNGGTFEAKC